MFECFISYFFQYIHTYIHTYVHVKTLFSISFLMKSTKKNGFFSSIFPCDFLPFLYTARAIRSFLIYLKLLLFDDGVIFSSCSLRDVKKCLFVYLLFVFTQFVIIHVLHWMFPRYRTFRTFVMQRMLLQRLVAFF